MQIRPFAETDWPQVWPIVCEVVRAGDTFVYDSVMTLSRRTMSGSRRRPG
jgi:hypothetical protein